MDIEVDMAKNSEGLKKYRNGVRDVGKELADKARELTSPNLLSAKIALWAAVKLIEDELREKKDG